ncbi:MAG: glycosyltransferase family 2 protein [Sphingomonadales bacterium]|nr:glycosyltransferase family 2 protein [Sphingomonadales bacterium]
MNVSVAMATYNGAAFLAEQLASIAGQTLRPAELVVSDDGSTDATLDIVTRFKARAPFPVRILENDARLGFGDNFLHAAQACRQPLIAFSDQDDVWLPDKLRAAAERLEADRSLLAMHTLTVTDSALRPTGFQWNPGISRDCRHPPLTLHPFGTGWGNTMLFRAELLGLIPRERRPRQPGQDRPLSHDTWIYVLASALGAVSHLITPLILYRQHGANVSGQTRQRKRNRWRALIRVPIGEYREHDRFDADMARLFAELAARPGPYGDAAAQAAERYRQRRAYWASRVGVFDQARFGDRFGSFRRTRALTADAPLWIGSRAKDFVLGVTRLGSSPIGSWLLDQKM